MQPAPRTNLVKFYLGTQQPGWLATAGVPLFVSHRRLAQRKQLPRATTGWALDSGGFSELSLLGEWRTTARQYNAAVRRYDDEIGLLEWAAPCDWMVEPEMLARTGLTIREHQRRTVANFPELQYLWSGPADSPYMPILQGWSAADYAYHLDFYDAAGVDLTQYPIVGVGSVCRRQATAEIDAILSVILARDPEMPLHVFGTKIRGLHLYGDRVETADSLAWSYQARREPPLAGHSHASCSNCLEYALRWRARVLAISPTRQMSLFDAAS
jgi:hypothetical protein